MKKLTFSFGLAVLLGTGFISPAQAGSGGAIGGNDGGSNLDSSVIIGGTFNDAVIILIPNTDVINLSVDPQTNSLFTSASFQSDLEGRLSTFNQSMQGEELEGTVQNSTVSFQCISNDSNCEVSSSAQELADKIKAILQTDAEQSRLVEDFAISLQGLTANNSLDPSQLDQAIKLYNQLINSLTESQLMAFRDNDLTQQVRSTLQDLRSLFTAQGDVTP